MEIKEYIYINLPQDLVECEIVKYYDIDWTGIINKTFIEITKLRIPVVLLKGTEENEILLLLNLGTSKQIFTYNKIEDDYHFMVFQKKDTDNNSINTDSDSNNSESSDQTINDKHFTMLIYNKIDSIEKFNEVLNARTNNQIIPIHNFYIKLDKFIDFLDSKLKTGNSCYPNLMKKKIKLTLLNIYNRIFNYLELNDTNGLKIYKNESYNLDDLYGYVYNNTNEFLEKIIENYELNNDIYNEIIPDFYILCGFEILPITYIRDSLGLLKSNSGNHCITYLEQIIRNYLSTNLWMHLFGIMCFCAQIIAPTYFILVSYNFSCPNKSYTINKFFAVIFFIIMYSQLFNALNELFTLYYKFDRTYYVKIRLPFYVGLFSNIIIIFIIPLFTYVLFMENNRIIDLILNCLSGIFLVNLDNELVNYFCDKEYLKLFCKDQLLLSYLNNGYRIEINNIYDTKHTFSIYNIINYISMTQFITVIFLSYRLFLCL